MLLNCLAKALLAYLLLAVLFALFGEYYGRALMPLFRWELNGLAPQFSIIELIIFSKAGSSFASLTIEPSGPLIIGSQILFSDNAIWPVTMTTPLAQSYQSPIVVLTASLAWPVRSKSHRALLLIIVLPVLLALAMLDIPLLLLGKFWADLYDIFAPGLDTLMAHWPAWLSDGGRLAMCATASLLAIAASERLSLVLTAFSMRRANPHSFRN